MNPPKAWRIFARPIVESVLNSQARQHRVPQPVIFHGPRGTGKTTLLLERLLGKWNTDPHITGYVDLAESIKENHPKNGNSYPWTTWANCPPPKLQYLTTQLEECLESMAKKGIYLGAISSHQIFKIVNKRHALSNVLKQIIDKDNVDGVVTNKRGKDLGLWDKAVLKLSVRCDLEERIGNWVVGQDEGEYYREALAALELAKEVIRLQQGKRRNAIRELNKTGRFSTCLAHSATDWPLLLLELLSASAEIQYFQPKLVINNVEVLKLAVLSDDTTVCGPMYHDSLIWRILALGVHETCIPIFLVTSDSYYSYRAFVDFGHKDIFVSHAMTQWTPAQATLHMAGDYFTSSECKVLLELLGTNPRHLFEFYALKLNNSFRNVDEKGCSFEDIVDAYLAYLQVTVVNPAMDKALSILQKFAMDARSGKIPKDKLRFGSPWRNPPRTDKPGPCREWAKIQLMDFIQSLSNAYFGVYYSFEETLEIFDDPSTVALLEVGMLYAGRYPPYLGPPSRGIERCLARWLVQEKIKMNSVEKLKFRWQRVIRGRSYRHLLPRAE